MSCECHIYAWDLPAPDTQERARRPPQLTSGAKTPLNEELRNKELASSLAK